MSNQGERGPHGDHGQMGDTGLTGEVGPTGESGPTGDTGDTGDRGPAGDPGQRGPVGKTGEQGPHYSSWLTRHIITAYGVLALGVVLGFVFTTIRFDQARDSIEMKARELCEAGNERSQIQREDLEMSAAQTQQLDIERLLGISPEAAADLRRLTKANTDRRIESLPFLDCRTGERMPARPAPTKPGGTP